MAWSGQFAVAVLVLAFLSKVCESAGPVRLSKAVTLDGRRSLRSNPANGADSRRLLKGGRYDVLDVTLPKCMPLAGTTCALNSAMLLEVLPKTNLQVPRGLNVPQLLYSQQAAAAVLCPDLWGDECIANSACKWEPEQLWCDINPHYIRQMSFCEGSLAKEYFHCAYARDDKECGSKKDECFFHGSRKSDGPKCLPESLKESSDDDILDLEARLEVLPRDEELYGCCPGLALLNRHKICTEYTDKDTCEKAQTRPADACLWDQHNSVCTADPVKLIIDVFSTEPMVADALQEENDACADVPLSSCQSKRSFARPEDPMLYDLLETSFDNSRCQGVGSVGIIGGGLFDYPPYGFPPPYEYSPEDLPPAGDAEQDAPRKLLLAKPPRTPPAQPKSKKPQPKKSPPQAKDGNGGGTG